MQPENKSSTQASLREPVALYSGEVMHRRLFPVNYRFVYRIMNLLIDIDRLQQANRSSFIFSINRRNLLAFYEEDHLPKDRPGYSLREWAAHVLQTHNISERPDKVFLLSFPRVLGWVFSPISIWYCLTDDDKPLAVICEVNNTFGEKHYYLLHQDSNPMNWPVARSHAKDFHVSPFIDMDANYEFRISRPADIATVGIREYQHGKLMLVAAVKSRLIRFNTLNLTIQALRVPFQTLKVLAAIHWHAFWIWLSGTPFYPKPPAPENEAS